MSDLPTVELRRITTNARMSRGTICYAAALFVDGRHVCDVMNDGNGGADRMEKPGRGLAYGEARRLYDELDRRVKTDFPKQNLADPGEPENMAGDSLEYMCARIVSDHMLLKTVRRDLKKNMLFYADGLPTAQGVAPLRMIRLDRELAKAAQLLRLRSPGAYILNEQSEADALAAYKLME